MFLNIFVGRTRANVHSKKHPLGQCPIFVVSENWFDQTIEKRKLKLQASSTEFSSRNHISNLIAAMDTRQADCQPSDNQLSLDMEQEDMINSIESKEIRMAYRQLCCITGNKVSS